MRTPLPMSLRLVALLLILVMPLGAQATSQFEEVTDQAGVTYIGPSWGGSWGDFNGDGLPDLWVINHYAYNSLFLNQGDGTFVDIYPEVVGGDEPLGDTHGAAWADFDNDGDQDLYQLADGGDDPDPAYLFVNQGDHFEEMGVALGADYHLGRGRMPLWFDFNRDGLLDILHATSHRAGFDDYPTAILQQNPEGGFTDITEQLGMELEFRSNDFNRMVDITDDGFMDLMVQQSGFPARIFGVENIPFADIQSDLGFSKVPVVVDAAIGDFDGDQDFDFFMVHGEIPYGFAQYEDNRVEARFIPFYDDIERGFSLRTSGTVSVGMWPLWVWTPEMIHIGAGGYHPGGLEFDLDPSNPNTWGLLEHEPASAQDLYIGFDPETEVWQFIRWERLTDMVVTSTDSIFDLTAIGWDPEELPRMDNYRENTGTGFANTTQAVGFTTPSSGRNAVAIDYDNDMDLDIFVVTTGPVINDPDRLFENDGTGHFTEVPDAAGAAGSLDGRGDAVAVADYDQDGFLDLFVTNGTSKAPFDQDGPSQLFRNLGNSNHWLQIDLVGQQSNRDAVGAQLQLTAGGVTQRREQDNGIHYRGQNHQRIHFGLGSHTIVDELIIRWPSGLIETYHDIAADQIISYTEGALSPVLQDGETPAAVRLHGCYPNPFNPTTTIAFTLAQPQQVELTIHDAAGRRITQLIRGEVFPAGINEVVWNGCNKTGQRMASGLYFYTLKAGDTQETRRMVMVK